MKKAFFAIMLTLAALPALAQYRPRPVPHPRPVPYPQNCTVVAVDRYNRVMAHFWGYTDPRNGMCRDGLRNCNLEIRRRGWYDARCMQVRNGRN
jgi:hypothetical protein